MIASSPMRPTGSPRKILQVTWSYFPYIGGVPTHAYEVATRLAKRGFDVTVLSTDPGGVLTREEIADCVRLIRVPAYPKDRDFYFAPQIFGAIQAGQWDIIHCQGVHSLVAPLAMMAALRTRTPYVMTFHSARHASALRNFLRPLQWRALRPLLRQASHLIAISDQEAVYFQKLLGVPTDRLSIIPNGSDLPAVDDQAIQRDETLIVTVGRLDPLKGHQRLIEALPRVLEQRPDVRLLIVGAGDYEAALREQARSLGIADRVEIRAISPIARQEMAKVLKQAGIVVFMSFSENSPIAAREAIAMGCSVLLTHTSGLAALAEKGLARSIPVESTSQEVADAIVSQIRHPFVPDQIDLIKWDDCVTAITDVYRRVVDPRCLPSGSLG